MFKTQAWVGVEHELKENHEDKSNFWNEFLHWVSWRISFGGVKIALLELVQSTFLIKAPTTVLDFAHKNIKQ